MTPKTICFAAVLVLSAAAASAIDFGAHLGYYDNDVKKGYLGVNLMVPLGMVVIAPNVDYWKEHGAGYWLGGADVDLRFTRPGPSFWVGAGPTYGYITGYNHISSGGYSTGIVGLQYTPPPTTPGTPGTNPSVPPGSASIGGPFDGKSRAWGWDINGGVTFSGTFRPYVTARYNKVKNLKAGGVAVGIRFGH